MLDYSCVTISFGFQIQPTTDSFKLWLTLELEPSDWLKGYAVITIFRTRGIVISQFAHEYSVTFQVNDFYYGRGPLGDAIYQI